MERLTRKNYRTGKKPVNDLFDRHTRFPIKLWNAVNDKTSNLLQWLDDGSGFYVNDDRFESEIMKAHPSLLQTNSFTNFRRQLRVYGFQWLINGNDFVFSHPYFIQNHQEQLDLIATVKCSTRPRTQLPTIHFSETAFSIQAAPRYRRKTKTAKRKITFDEQCLQKEDCKQGLASSVPYDTLGIAGLTTPCATPEPSHKDIRLSTNTCMYEDSGYFTPVVQGNILESVNSLAYPPNKNINMTWNTEGQMMMWSRASCINNSLYNQWNCDVYSPPNVTVNHQSVILRDVGSKGQGHTLGQGQPYTPPSTRLYPNQCPKASSTDHCTMLRSCQYDIFPKFTNELYPSANIQHFSKTEGSTIKPEMNSNVDGIYSVPPLSMFTPPLGAEVDVVDESFEPLSLMTSPLVPD